MSQQQQVGPDPMTPQWSRDLAEAGSSPLWGDWDDAAGTARRDTFLEQASQYATYEDLPGDLKALYQQALAAREETADDDRNK